MMPSVDKVGRHFPLTIAVALDPQPEILATVFAAQNWFAAIELVALSSLNMDFPVDELEEWLTATPFDNLPPPDYPGCTAARELAAWWNGRGRGPVVLSLPDLDAIADVVSAGGLNILLASGFGKSLWWTRDELTGVSQLQGFFGLPPEEHFAILLAGEVSGQKSM